MERIQMVCPKDSFRRTRSYLSALRKRKLKQVRLNKLLVQELLALKKVLPLQLSHLLPQRLTPKPPLRTQILVLVDARS